MSFPSNLIEQSYANEQGSPKEYPQDQVNKVANY